MKNIKNIKLLSLLLSVVLLAVSCEKHEIDYDATPVDDKALFQLHLMIPVPAANSAYYVNKIELDDKSITNNNTLVLNTYNAVPSAAVGLFFTTDPGTHNLKLYTGTVSTGYTLVYDKNIEFPKGKHNVIVYDYNSLPSIINNGQPFFNDNKSYDTDTIGFIKFYNLMFENAVVKDNVLQGGEPTKLKLQYQYQYILHPLYTLADAAAGTIPEGKKVGDTTGDTSRSAWFNLGQPVAFGEATGWERVPVKKSSYISQGAANIYYRIFVAEGGIVGVNMDADGLLLTNVYNNVSLRAYTDYWSLTIGRRTHQFFTGYRVIPSVRPTNTSQIAWIRQFTAL
jgi:hypothetical protein